MVLISQRILVCQNRTCRKQGSKEVLAAFQEQAIAGVEIIGSSCLGQCGNGPMVLVLPQEIWYDRVDLDRVAAILSAF
jgi:NADH:ubiquinone oxidoreductase subunit E